LILGVVHKLKTALLLCVVVSALFACATTGFNSQRYTVKSGDTLYFIAWKYKVDFKQLAQWNSLSDPYHVYPGDRLLINPPNFVAQPRSTASRKNNPPNLSAYTVRKGDTLYSIARQQRLAVGRIVALNKLSRPYTIYPGQRLALKSGSRAPNRVVATKPSSSSVAKQPGSKVVGLPNPNKWLWPTEGKVVKGFKGSKTIQQGIDISGRMGQTVRSAATGVVVYSGSGLVNYGQLVIVKHNENFLSAYGYNSKLLVKEGEKVKAGQAIAEMGKVGQGAPLLHFEIRKYGKPINPIGHLPKRG
jgi:lipoprotein NlpD